MPETRSGESSRDSALEAALDSFVDWARHAPGHEDVEGLPPLHDLEELDPGTVLDDFQLVRRLGQGGMGVVYEAHQRSLGGRRVAVKLLRNVFESERLAERFRREIATIAGLDHPAIVPIVGANVADGTPFYAMKYVAGMPASKLLRELRASGTVPPTLQRAREAVVAFEEASSHDSSASLSTSSAARSSWGSDYVRWVAALGRTLAEALQHAHEHGVVHRDVKPGNVVVTPAGQPVLLDFGLASTEGDPSLTAHGDFVGTAAYAPPEQVRGEPVDTRADVYALGATLYELLTLRRPFDAQSRTALLHDIEREEPRSLGAHVPRDLRTILGCALAKSPARRYATPGDMAHDLREFLAGRPIVARPPGPVARLVQLVRRYPRVATAAAVAAALLLGLRLADRARAAAWVERGRASLRNARELRAEIDLNLERTRALMAQSEGGVAVVHRELDDLSLERGRLRPEVDAAFDEAEAELVRAFEHVARHAGARRLLADLRADRVRLALRDYDDLLHPARLRALEAALADTSGEEHERWLRPQGRVDLSCDAADAVADVEDADGHLLLDGEPLPLRDLALPEGSYVARVRAPGRVPTRYPFLVRRDAAYEDPEARPPRALAITLLGRDRVPADMVQVPGGWTLVGDDPPEWRELDAFLIQRHEATNALLVSWWQELARRGEEAAIGLGEDSDSNRPRFRAGDPHLVRAADGSWTTRDRVELDHPVRGLTPMEIGFYARVADYLATGLPDGWYLSLPTAAEWTRAFRGADARAYPWGDEFSWARAAGFFSLPEGDRQRPPLVGTFPGDVSPFGVVGLAGSVTELTADLAGPNPGSYVGCGGSYRSAAAHELRFDARAVVQNRLLEDVGFRLVARPRPAWTTPRDDVPARFQDDFERSGDAGLGAGWTGLVGAPLGLRTDPGTRHACRLDAGRLVVEGGRDDFSELGSAWHPLAASPPGTRVAATLSIGALEPEPGKRWFIVSLRHGFFPAELEDMSLLLGLDGSVRLQRTAFVRASAVADGSPFEPGGQLRVELVLRPEGAEATVTPLSGGRAGGVELRLPEPLRPPRFLGFMAPNLIGGRIEVEDVEVAPAD